ncbi:MFS transporter [Sphingomonas prati]|uniref:PAT family beta-lactamase induction signal transducer AmpG n=1 Tax=Sphingomonas prati TaxID=1843237 RepID=A0A7W9BR74_9SPHN|nr:permease [Sphingomonas prati]MBB5728661.1 PAT family beta-lactamase induction signal transducer AmpG [Sphingomonas prati]GGE72072.1 permease [Sphingomonas prati]
MTDLAATAVHSDDIAKPATDRRGMLLYGLLGFAAGLPFYMFSTVLVLRLQAHGVALTVLGFFAWVQLLPTLKFVWAPLLDRYDIPGFGRYWGKRRGWIMLAQLGIFSAMIAMAATSDDANLAVTALFAVLLAFWTTTLEVAADAWRIELYPSQEQQGPIVAANLWGYRSAMVAAGSGALLIAAVGGWALAYLLIAAAALLPFPILVAMRADADGTGGRVAALTTGLIASAVILGGALAVTAAVGWVLLAIAAQAGIDAGSNVTPWVLGMCMLPFVAMAIALPRIRRSRADSALRTSTALGPYVDFFWRYGYAAILLMVFVSLYRMGDVLALNLSKPMIKELGYSLTQIGRADSLVALGASVLGVGLGGLMAAKRPMAWALAVGAVVAAIGNFGFVWLAHQRVDEGLLYIATAADQFGNGFAGAVFVVYFSLLVNPRYPGAQYAFLTGFAFLLPRLLAGAGGAMVGSIGYDGFFLLSGVVSLAAILFVPALSRVRARSEEA